MDLRRGYHRPCTSLSELRLGSSHGQPSLPLGCSIFAGGIYSPCLCPAANELRCCESNMGDLYKALQHDLI